MRKNCAAVTQPLPCASSAWNCSEMKRVKRCLSTPTNVGQSSRPITRSNAVVNATETLVGGAPTPPRPGTVAVVATGIVAGAVAIDDGVATAASAASAAANAAASFPDSARWNSGKHIVKPLSAGSSWPLRSASSCKNADGRLDSPMLPVLLERCLFGVVVLLVRPGATSAIACG